MTILMTVGWSILKGNSKSFHFKLNALFWWFGLGVPHIWINDDAPFAVVSFYISSFSLELILSTGVDLAQSKRSVVGYCSEAQLEICRWTFSVAPCIYAAPVLLLGVGYYRGTSSTPSNTRRVLPAPLRACPRLLWIHNYVVVICAHESPRWHFTDARTADQSKVITVKKTVWTDSYENVTRILSAT